MGGNSGGGGRGGRSGGGGGGTAKDVQQPGEVFRVAESYLTAKQEAAHIKQTKSILRGASQETIKEFTAATERQIKGLTPADMRKIGTQNYQRMVLEYNTARSMIKPKGR